MYAYLYTFVKFIRRAWAAFFLSFLCHSLPGFALDLGRKVEFNVPFQPLASAVIQFSKQADIQVIASGQKLDGVSSKGVQGSYTIDEGLKVLLDGTGFTFKVVGDNTISLTSARAAADQSKDPAAFSVLQTAAIPLEGIIVSAQKRDERLIDVPISIAVVTKDEIDRRGLISPEDYLRGIPGVNQVSYKFGAGTVTIRGIETTPEQQNFSSGTTVATYFGETPTTNTAGVGGSTNVDIKLVDIERIEVLRGPKGTAF